jgi:FdhE protein
LQVSIGSIARGLNALHDATYDRRIDRAGQLASAMPDAAEILRFYVELAKLQKTIFESATDEPHVGQFTEALVELVGRTGTPELKALPPVSMEAITSYWHGERSGSPQEQFFARVLLQPYMEFLANSATPDIQTTAPVCPFCRSKPVAAVLRGEGEGAKRSLICSLCATEWLFRRVACPNCGEADKDKLSVFIAEQTDYVRVEACNSCGTYLKSIDLARNGHAIPIVDELATVALSIWADEHGFSKAEPNLLGL